MARPFVHDHVGRPFRHSLPDRLGDQITPVVHRAVHPGLSPEWWNYRRNRVSNLRPSAKKLASCSPRETMPVRETVAVSVDGGLLGSDSVAWELHASPAMLTAGLRALLLQVWHPSIASAVAMHSAVARD